MNNSTNIRRQEQLGIPFGTACGRLRKQLLFKYVKLAGHDKCFVCNLPIESIDEFTIEHKNQWLDIDPKLFWDLDNIAFSHSKCNLPHRRRGKKSKRIKDNLWLCFECKKYKPKEKFSLYSHGSPRTRCKPCRAKQSAIGNQV